MLNDKRITLIPSLLHNNKFISNFKEKNKLLNEHFSKLYALRQNRNTITSVFTPLTQKSLSSFQFAANNIKSDSNKEHSHDTISIRMIKLCGDSIYRQLEMIFKSSLNQGIFLAEWKKANVVPVYKAEDYQCVKN